jgi:carbohydrate kinase (thermoresistant glucokinase family)
MTVLVVMGVSGTGKTTVARMLAARLGWKFIESEDFHPQANIDKMARGQRLTDEDRRPWLTAVAACIDGQIRAAEPAVIACPAYKRSYRDVVRAPGVVFVHLSGDRELLQKRLAARHGHFRPDELLARQLADLEPPDAGERAVTVDVSAGPSDVVDDILARLAE